MESSPASSKIRVLVAGNSCIHTELLSKALQRDPDLVVVNWDASASGLTAAILGHHVDVLAISCAFRDHNADALKLVQQLRSLSPRTKAVVLLDSQEEELIINAFRLGARGVFSRESSLEMFCKCIHRVHSGEIWADNRGVLLAVDALASTPLTRAGDAAALKLLSRRESEVVQCVVQGMTNREIAQRLGLSQHTVKNYLFRVFDKLGVSSRVELLFKTLGQGKDDRSRAQEQSPLVDVAMQLFEGGPRDGSAFAILERLAEKGTPGAQWCLAQSLAARGGPEDLVTAYAWFLIASEQAMRDRTHVARKLTAKHIEQAQQRASLWLARETLSSAAITSPEFSNAKGEIAELRTALQCAQEGAKPVAAGIDASGSPNRDLDPGSRVSAEGVFSYGSA